MQILVLTDEDDNLALIYNHFISFMDPQNIKFGLYEEDLKIILIGTDLPVRKLFRLNVSMQTCLN